MPKYTSEATAFSVALSTTAQVVKPHGSAVSIDIQNREATLGMLVHLTKNPWSIVFDGTDDVVDCDASATDIATGSTAGSIKVGLNVDSGGSGRRTIFSISDANTETAFWLEVDTNNYLSASLVIGGTVSWTLLTSQAIPLDEWIELKIVHNGTQATMFVDQDQPVQAFSVDTSLTHWLGDLTGVDTANIGALDYNSAGDANFFEGSMDYVFTVDGNGSLAANAAKTFWVKMTEGTGTALAEIVNSNTTTIGGSAAWATRGAGLLIAAGAGRIFHIEDDCDVRNGIWVTNADGSSAVAGVYKVGLSSSAR